MLCESVRVHVYVRMHVCACIYVCAYVCTYMWVIIASVMSHARDQVGRYLYCNYTDISSDQCACM